MHAQFISLQEVLGSFVAQIKGYYQPVYHLHVHER